jgi:hypothetical protein
MPSTTSDLSTPIEEAHCRFAPCFGRSETGHRSRRYLAGLLSSARQPTLPLPQLNLAVA